MGKLRKIIILVFGAFVLGVLFAYLKTAAVSDEVHYVSINDKEFYENAYRRLTDLDEKFSAKTGIVNHHLLAPHLIARVLNGMATDDPITVVLISPNHFASGEGRFTTTDHDWQTPYGIVKADTGAMRELKEKNLTLDPFPFDREHGISNIVPFIKKTFPQARIVPIMVRESTRPADIEEFSRSLARILPDDAVVIGSFDFSHGQTSVVADEHDVESLTAIRNLDFEALSDLDIDSRSGLHLLLAYVRERNTSRFTVLEQTNSSKLLKDLARTDTTSYITGFFTVSAAV